MEPLTLTYITCVDDFKDLVLTFMLSVLADLRIHHQCHLYKGKGTCGTGL